MSDFVVKTPKKPLNSPYLHYKNMADMLDKTINSILTAFIAVILIASAFIPVAISQINAIPTLVDIHAGDPISSVTPYVTLLSVVIIVTIVGIVVGVIKQYTDSDYEGER